MIRLIGGTNDMICLDESTNVEKVKSTIASDRNIVNLNQTRVTN